MWLKEQVKLIKSVEINFAAVWFTRVVMNQGTYIHSNKIKICNDDGKKIKVYKNNHTQETKNNFTIVQILC